MLRAAARLARAGSAAVSAAAGLLMLVLLAFIPGRRHFAAE